MLSVSALLQMASIEKKSKTQMDTLDVTSSQFNPGESRQDSEVSTEQDDIPTLEEIAFLSASQANLLPEDLPLPDTIKNLGEQLAQAGLNEEQLEEIAGRVRKQVMKEISSSLQTALSKAVARTVATATRDIRKHIQKQIEDSLPDLIDQAIARSRDKI